MTRLRVVALIVVALLLAGSAPVSAQVIPQRPGSTFNFQGNDLSEVLSTLAQAAGVNIILTNIPARSVTMRTFTPLQTADLIALMRNLAAINSVNVTEANGFMSFQGAGGVAEVLPDTRQLFIYKLRHARAPVLAQTLASLFGSGGTVRTGTTTQTLSQQLQQLNQQQRPVPPQVIVQGGGSFGGGAIIVPDDATNSLLVRATPNDWAIMQQAVQALDLRPLQVVIEVVIAEVRRTSDLDVGVEIRGVSTEGNGDRITRGNLGNPSDSASVNNFTLRVIRTGEINVEATLSAFAQSGNVRVLSRPVIQAQNNQEARINVGEQRPFVAIQQSVPTGNEGIINQSVSYREVSTNLTITPTINVDGYVNLAVLQEVNDATGEIQFGAPVITTKSAQTQLLVRDGQTVVIGGLIDNADARTRGGIPYLKDIPIIGFLFGTTVNTKRNSELFLFLTPHIVDSDEDEDRIRQEIELNTILLRRLGPITPLITPIPLPGTERIIRQ